MYIINVKLNFKKLFFIFMIATILICSIIELCFENHSLFAKNDEEKIDYIVSESNYIEVLEKINNNIDENIGKSITLSGFVYKPEDLNEDFFICGRYTVADNETKIAGFICNYVSELKLMENEWIEIKGSIIKGEYNGSVPVVKVDIIKKIVPPANTYI